MSLLAVVPARAGSKGVPGKALRTVGGVPMILRTLRTVVEAGIADRIVVSTDDQRVKSFCEMRGYEVLDRPPELAGDDVPLRPVADHAAEYLGWQDDVALLQPTCPLLKAGTLRMLHTVWRTSEATWGITVVDDLHTYWHDGEPVGDREANRQLREPIQRETGAVQFFKPEAFVSGAVHTRKLLPISAREGLDVDTPDDLQQANALARRARIHFVVAMGPLVGTGHFHRSLTLARALSHHRITWEWRGEPTGAACEQLLGVAHAADDELPDLTIFDCLSVYDDELIPARALGPVVVLEDEFYSARALADLAVNSMLDPADLRYEVLREEFLGMPERPHIDKGNYLVVTFGGTDPAGLTRRFASLFEDAYPPVLVDVVEPGEETDMAARLRAGDVVLTSQGRTVFEAAACGTPCISIAANERESRHVQIPGVTYLGLHSTVTDDVVRQAVTSTLASRELREEKAATAARHVDGRGAERLVRRIEDLLL